ncbi:MAG: ABC transporter ATP-binding protein, partial [Sulfolobales archaeon]
MAVLEVRNLISGYGKLKVLYNINLDISEKEITVVVGPNGAGKTTLLNSIMGIATIYDGSVYYNGEKISGLPTHKISRMGIAYLPQMGNVFSELTVYENLRLASYLLDRSEVKDRMDEVLGLFPVLEKFINRKAGTLSGGERRMLAIAMALMRRPKVILLDEITTDLAPIIAKRVLKQIVDLRDKLGLTILIVEQLAKLALELGNQAYLLVSGTIRYSGKALELLNHPDFSELYL